MATLNQLVDALKKADAAGNTEDARRLAEAIRQQRMVGGGIDNEEPLSFQEASYTAPLQEVTPEPEQSDVGATASAFGDFAVGGLSKTVGGGIQNLADLAQSQAFRVLPLGSFLQTQAGFDNYDKGAEALRSEGGVVADTPRFEMGESTLRRQGLQDAILGDVARAGSSVGSLAGGIGVYALTGPAGGAAAMAAPAFSDTYREGVDELGLTPQEALERAAPATAAEFALDRIGLKYIMPRSARLAAEKAGGSLAGKVVKGAGGEGITEGLTEVAHIGLDALGGYQELPTLEEGWKRVRGATVGGAFLGGGVRAGTAFADAKPSVQTGDPAIDAGAQAAADIAAKDQDWAKSVEGNTAEIDTTATVTPPHEVNATAPVSPSEPVTPPTPALSIPEAMSALDSRLEALDAASQEGRLSRTQMKALEREEGELSALLQEQSRMDREGVVPSDPAARLRPEEREVATTRLAEIRATREKARASKNYEQEARELRERLAKVEGDNDLVSIAKEITGKDVRQPEPVEPTTTDLPIEPDLPPEAPSRVTRKMRAQLRDAGFDSQTIRDMSPRQAWFALNPLAPEVRAESEVTPQVTPTQPVQQSSESIQVTPDVSTNQANPIQVPQTEAEANTVLQQAKGEQISRARVESVDPTVVVDPETGERNLTPDNTQRQELESFFNPEVARQEGFEVVEETDTGDLRPSENSEGDSAGKVRIPSSPESLDASLFASPAERKGNARVEQVLRESGNAAEVLNRLSQTVPENSPTSRLIKSLLTGNDLAKNKVVLLNPEDFDGNAPPEARYLFSPDKPNTKGIYFSKSGNIYIRGSGFKKNGVDSVETVLHEIVHAGTVQKIKGVKDGKITDERTVKAVKDLERLYEAFRRSSNDFDQFDPKTRQRLKYAATQLEEFPAVLATSPDVQVALRKEGLFKTLVDIVRRMLGLGRSDVQFLDRVLDATNRIAESRAQEAPPTLDFLGEQAPRRNEDPLELPDVESVKQSARSLGKTIATFVTPNKGQHADIARFPDKVKGIKRGMDAQVVQKSNNLKQKLKANFKDNDSQLKALEEVRKFLTDRDNDGSSLPRSVRESAQRLRDEIDQSSKRIGKEVIRAYAGKPMPEAVSRLLGSLRDNIGEYVTRAYEIDFSPKAGKTLMQQYDKGNPAAVARVQPAIDLLTSKIGNLPSRVQDAKDRAEALNAGLTPGQEKFSPWDVFDEGAGTLKSYYTDLFGNPSQATNKEAMYKQLESFASEFGGNKDKAKTEARMIVEDLVGAVSKDASTKMGQYYRGIRTDDRVLRRREQVPPWLKELWGEIKDPLALASITLSRQTAAEAPLRVANQLAESSPNLFSPNRTETKRSQLPKDPLLYGKLAGSWVTPEAREFLEANARGMGQGGSVREALIAGDSGAAVGSLAYFGERVLAKATHAAKTSMVVLNPYPVITNIGNFLIVPLSNGNFNPKYMARAAVLNQELLGTGYRSNREEVSPELREILDLGVIDPVILQVNDEVRQIEKDAQILKRTSSLGKGTLVSEVRGVGRRGLIAGREFVNFVEVTPKVANYLYTLDVVNASKMYKDLSVRERKEVAARLTNDTNITYSKVPLAARSLELLQLNSFTNFMEESFRAPIMSVAAGMKQIRDGARNKDAEWAMAGAKRLAGSATALIAVPAFHTATLAAGVGIMNFIGSSFMGIGEDSEDEMRILQASPFYQPGMTRAILDVQKDSQGRGVNILMTDGSRLDTQDPYHSAVRGGVELMSLISEGKLDEAEEYASDYGWGQLKNFFSGGIAGRIGLSLLQDKKVHSSLKNSAPETYNAIVNKFGSFRPWAETAIGVVDPLIPGAVKGVVRGFEAKKVGKEDWQVALESINTPIQYYNPWNELSSYAATVYKGETRDAADPLRTVMVQSSTEVDKGQIEALVQDYVDNQKEAWDNMMKQVLAAQAANRIYTKKEENHGIREALKDGGASRTDINNVLQGKFVPSPISSYDKAVRDALNKAPNEGRRAAIERAIKERQELINQAMQEQIDKYRSAE